MSVVCYIGLGANLGDRDAQIARALQRLASVPGVQVLAVSPLVETDPVGGPPQPRYRNGVARLETTLSAHALWQVLLELEREAGRTRTATRDTPRPLDLDLLLFGEETIDTKDLVVPHPRMHERAFVTGPLRELGVDARAIARAPRPRIVSPLEELAARCTAWLHGGCTVGLVPTMGALHDGHASLMRIARAECDRVVATIFVNPLQFGPTEDFASYPRTLAQDLVLLRACDVDLVFTPERTAMFGSAFASQIAVGAEAEGMEGAARPGHFAGVATVVAKLLALVRPTRGYFGKKDAQQVAVIRRMTKDLGFPTEIRECETVREPDGLAMSSRNVYLTPEDRAAASVLQRALAAARDAHARGEHAQARLLALARETIRREPRARLEYLELRSDDDLLPLPAGASVTRARMLVVASFGTERRTRLLDNMTIGAGGG